MATIPLITLELRYEHDVVLARQRGRQIARLLGFDSQDQTRIATAISELARNAFEYAGGGKVSFAVEREPGGVQLLMVQIRDEGPGIRDVQAILDGRYRSPTGMGLGILGARRLTERFRIDSVPGRGTTVEIARTLKAELPLLGAADAVRIADDLARITTQGPFEEIQRQNQELLRALDEIRTRQAQVEKLNAELEATNRGVLALYAELDDRAQDLKRASEQKSNFLSDISHELRTPLTSVQNLARLLLDRTDGDLTQEQERQVTLITQAVDTVTQLVNDLLDIAKIEAGRMTLRPTDFTVAELFGALQGICRPLLVSDAVTLSFEDRSGGKPLRTDDQRLAQILRNFISNAIKFTEQGEIRVVATADGAGGDELLRFSVSDTGLGIAPDDRERIFQEYVQVDIPSQRRRPGTGLGLPLTRKLASLLGGRIELESELGHGSIFSVVIPRRHSGWSVPEVGERTLPSAGAGRRDAAWTSSSETRSL
ncbi:MAG TPA: ATP-binding protein [Gemmatimonadaceae bacterium]|nr:ATP-binding protein [Gemmatimonadaceae bacterium]